MMKIISNFIGSGYPGEWDEIFGQCSESILTIDFQWVFVTG